MIRLVLSMAMLLLNACTRGMIRGWSPASIARHSSTTAKVQHLKHVGRGASVFEKYFMLHESSSDVTHGDDASSNFFITTPIYYVNGLPHLGHAYTSVLCDIIARFHRKDGRKVYFLTGTDEHGQKVEQSALKNDTSPILFADQVSGQFRALATRLDCSHDDFIRTTEHRHKLAVEDLWRRLEANGQIYLGAYEGWYSVRDEAFYSEGELVEGKAPTGAEVEWVKEESYFFRLSQWTDKLLAFYESHPDFIAPRGRRNEVVSFVTQEGGLQDLSISRTTFSWGIPVPGNPKHVIYVWLDALTNYLSALEYPNTSSDRYQQFWPASLHVVGKDILRFHAIFWPAFLMAAGLEPPKRVFAHGWWTRDGEKMSKSVGNVLDPHELLDRYGVDYLRYYLAAEITFGSDGDFSHELFRNKINTELANDLGNLLQRTLTLVSKHCDGCIPVPGDFTAEDEEVLRTLRETVVLIRSQVQQQQGIKAMCELIIQLARIGNKYIDVQAPWVLVKTDRPRVLTVLYVLSELLRHCAILLEPVMPASCSRMLDMMGVPKEGGARSFEALRSPLTPGCRIGSPIPVFPKLEAPLQVEAPVLPSPRSASVSSPPSPELREVLSVEQLSQRIAAAGDGIRTRKASKASKDELRPLIEELNYLKNKFKELNNGIAYEAPAVAKE